MWQYCVTSRTQIKVRAKFWLVFFPSLFNHVTWRHSHVYNKTGKERFSRSAASECEKKSAGMNGYRSEQEEQSSTVGQICCLVEDNERCKRPAGNASYSKRIQKTVSQRKLKLSLDVNVSENFFRLNPFINPIFLAIHYVKQPLKALNFS